MLSKGHRFASPIVEPTRLAPIALTAKALPLLHVLHRSFVAPISCCFAPSNCYRKFVQSIPIPFKICYRFLVQFYRQIAACYFAPLRQPACCRFTPLIQMPFVRLYVAAGVWPLFGCQSANKIVGVIEQKLVAHCLP
ncbi:hypothetical protein PVK06_016628 [Gossypium arboreum]|uniref:Uncharacterized protein n=1 Tax=Gossypium arboreum TaxID=29729 RepID=A0ABR0Q0I3_GOSAR|nr:hypothetical protein PVK06_016628 [Gossypium arboreum]